METITCPRCGLKQTKGKEYCLYCGFEFYEHKPLESKEKILICEKCGAQMEPTWKSCPNCERQKKQKEKERKIAEENERKKERRHKIILALIFLFLLASIFGLQ